MAPYYALFSSNRLEQAEPLHEYDVGTDTSW